jgi:uncharacterized DUF497 family protein
MQFEWDENKDRSNQAKHGIAFEYACEIWLDPNYVIYEDRTSTSEERWNAIGLVEGQFVLLAVHTYRGADEDIVRIISARKATPHECRRYQEGALG